MPVKKLMLLLLVLAATARSSYAQDIDSLIVCPPPGPSPDTLDGQQVYLTAGRMPEFPGGMHLINTWMLDNMDNAVPNDELLSKVIITCVIDTFGKVRNARILWKSRKEKVSPIEVEALKAVMKMPAWTPAMNEGKLIPVRIYIAMNIDYK